MANEDYTANSKKSREQRPAAAAEKKVVEKVVTSEVVVKKKGLGIKLRSLVAEADIRSVIRYVASDVLIPAIRNLVVDSATKGVERMMYGDTGVRRRMYGQQQSRTIYNSPINRGLPSGSRYAPAPSPGPRSRIQDDFILGSREEGEAVLEKMNDIIDAYDVVSVSDLNELVGFPTTHIDQKWGWTSLRDVQIRQVREGYLIDLPPAEPINL